MMFPFLYSKIKNLIAGVIVLLFCFAATAQSDSIRWQNKILPHPRLLLLPGDEQRIQANIQNDASWRKIHQVIIREADKMIDSMPLERILIGRRLLGVSREALHRIFFLSYAWRMTHKEQYAKRAEKELLQVCNFPDWNHTRHYLDVAEMTMAVAIGYDWLYDQLPEQSRNLIREAILKKGLEPSLQPKYTWWLTGTNNWNQVCNAGMAYGAMAIYDDNPQFASSIINRSIKSVVISMKAAYAPDGAFPEGYGYWGYGTVFNVMLIDALDRLFGKDFGLSLQPGFLKTAAYMENMTGASGKSFNYSDAGGGWGPQPAMAWFAKRLKDPSLLWIEHAEINKAAETKALAKERMLPAYMIWGMDIGLDKPNVPTSNVFVGGGMNPVAMLRTSWTDPDAIYVGLKTGTPNSSHAHMDAGSFVMDAGGVRWAMDLGMQDYESLESKGIDLWNYKQNSQRWQVYRYNNFHHNTLTVNDSLQYYNGKATITGYSDAPQFMCATTDLSELYSNGLAKANRGVAIVNMSYVVVRDELEAGDKVAKVRWTMVTGAAVNIAGKNEVELVSNGKQLKLQIAEPADATLSVTPAVSGQPYDAANPGISVISFEVIVPAHTKQSVSVLLLPQNATGSKVQQLNEWPVRTDIRY